MWELSDSEIFDCILVETLEEISEHYDLSTLQWAVLKGDRDKTMRLYWEQCEKKRMSEIDC